jgi:lipoprotein-releasing system ATP-binding protein
MRAPVLIEARGEAVATSMRVSDVHKRFETETRPVEVLRGVSLEMAAGQALAITGPSGSGKSTLLHLIGALDAPTSGRIEIDGREAYRLPGRELARFRNRTIGFVFQEHHLLPQYSVLENVLIPTLAGPDAGPDAGARARGLLDRVGMADRLDHRPAELSGGERQRVAVARALINGPGLLLCDEPTGSLDAENARAVAALLFELHRETGTLLIAVTHNEDLAARFERRLELREGRCFER